MNWCKILFIASCFAQLQHVCLAQVPINCHLTKGETEYPYKDKKAEMVFKVTLMEDTAISKLILPDIKGDVFLFKFGLDWLFEQNTYFLRVIKENNYLLKHNIVVIGQNNGSIYNMIIDENGNNNFRDDKIIKAKLGERMYKSLNLLLDSTSNLYYQIAVETGIENTPVRAPMVYCRNLTKFTLKQPLEDTTLTIDILANYLYPNFKIKTQSLTSDSVELQNIVIGEPFYFNGKLRVLNNLNIFKQTVELRTLGKDELPFGYRVGYYLNMPRLMDLSATATYPINWSTPEYYLLYFWGHWCQPCMKKLPETKKLAADLWYSKKVAMISYPMVFSNKDLPKLEKLIQKDSFLCPQVVQNAALFTLCDDVENAKPFINGCNVISLVRNHEYPTYILINRRGKILFRGPNKNNELEQILNDLKF
jgi:thiol-disulfide isomerase/thioredoxin